MVVDNSLAGSAPLRYAITALSAGLDSYRLDTASARRMRLHQQLHQWLVDEVEFIQLREKNIEIAELYGLALACMQILCSQTASSAPKRPRLLLNSRVDVALAAGADGVHLTAHPGELTPAEVRRLFRQAGHPDPIISRSCHTLDDIRSARHTGADLLLFGPVFEKRVAGTLVQSGLGLERLHQACHAAQGTPVLALGGITNANAPQCLATGAAGVAGVRCFHVLH